MLDWSIWLWVFGFVLTSIQQASNLTWLSTFIVSVQHLKIMRNPSSINKNTTWFSLFIEMSVKRYYNLDSSLSISCLFNLNLLRVIEHTLNFDFLKRVFIFDFIDTLLAIAPEETLSVLRSDINCLFWKQFFSIISYLLKSNKQTKILICNIFQ